MLKFGVWDSLLTSTKKIMKALVIEDADVMGERIAQALEKLGVETVWIRFLSEAEEKIRAGGYDVVVLDACFGTTSEPNTTPLIPMIRVTGFTGPIIANSNSHNVMRKSL